MEDGQEIGSGEVAQELLGEDDGSAWDMLDWANVVLGRKKLDGTSSSNSSSNSGGGGGGNGISGGGGGAGISSSGSVVSSVLSSPASREFTK